MRTTRLSIVQVLPFLGTGLMLAGLLAGPCLPSASAAGMDSSAYQYHWGVQYPYGYQHPWGQRDEWRPRDPWGQPDHRRYRHDWPPPRPRYELPDRYTIHKGKKCELRCERIRGTRDYRCREYRC